MNSFQNSHVHYNDLEKLNDYELGGLRKQIEEEIALQENAVNMLKARKAKVLHALDSLDRMPIRNSIMLPLTGSVYVMGEVSAKDEVIIEVGAGCFVKQNIDSAKKFFRRRLTGIGKELAKKHKVIIQKSINKCIIYRSIENRLNETIAAMNALEQETIAVKRLAAIRTAAVVHADTIFKG